MRIYTFHQILKETYKPINVKNYLCCAFERLIKSLKLDAVASSQSFSTIALLRRRREGMRAYDLEIEIEPKDWDFIFILIYVNFTLRNWY